MTVRDELIAARAMIDAPDKWCKREGFVWRGCNLLGGGIRIEEKHCALFALNAVRASHAAHDAALMQVPRAFSSVDQFNDDALTTHADVMRMFDRAIDAA